MKPLLTILFILPALAASSQKFNKIPAATDSTYGYTMETPLLMPYNKTGKSYDYFTVLMENLVTHDNQKLALLKHTTMRDADVKKSFPRLTQTDYQYGIFKKSRYGLKGTVERFQFLTEQSKDTVTLYVDMDAGARVQIPVGLKVANK